MEGVHSLLHRLTMVGEEAQMAPPLALAQMAYHEKRRLWSCVELCVCVCVQYVCVSMLLGVLMPFHLFLLYVASAVWCFVVRMCSSIPISGTTSIS